MSKKLTLTPNSQFFGSFRLLIPGHRIGLLRLMLGSKGKYLENQLGPPLKSGKKYIFIFFTKF